MDFKGYFFILSFEFEGSYSFESSKSGRSLWVKKWISFFSTGVTEKKKEKEEEEEEEESESFVLIV